MAEGRLRPAWAEIDLDAVRHNVALLRRCALPAALCAVVKADAYGHGAVPVARAALDAGAARLAVALVDEGIELRDAKVSAPVLVLSEPADLQGAEAAVGAGLAVTLASPEGLALVAAAARNAGTRATVHVKVDTGMHRLGIGPAQAPALAAAVAADPALRLEAIWTHLSVADGTSADDRAFTALQLERFDAVVRGLGERPTLVHAANTAATVAWPASRYDMVRCGIGIYGLPPAAHMADDSPGGAGAVLGRLRPALSLRARVSALRVLEAGERPSYGRRLALERRSVVATVPLGYADGVRRALFDAGCSVLVRGRRRRLAGVVTMDQVVVDCGDDDTVSVGDEVTFIGRQGGEEIGAMEWAAMVGTIGYEVVCGIGARVPRVHVGASAEGWGAWRGGLSA